jgi:hypothetical protein
VVSLASGQRLKLAKLSDADSDKRLRNKIRTWRKSL